MSTVTNIIEDEIRATAIERWGCFAASVTRYEARLAWDEDDAGEWFALLVKQHLGDDWQIVARRRTRRELLGLVKRWGARFTLSPEKPKLSQGIPRNYALPS